jgi:hypothetical protein
MNSDHGSDERAERRTDWGDQLQSYAEVLARVILAGRMVHGVTICLSVKDEQGKPAVVSQTATFGGSQSEQALYALEHLRRIKAAAQQAIEQVQAQAEKELEARRKEPS